MTVLAVLPARRGSMRLPNKPLQLLGGVPLIVRVWERVCALDVATSVVIASDDEEIVEVATAAGAMALMTRVEHPSGTDRVAEVANRAEFATHDIVLNVQGDEPFVDADAVRGAVDVVHAGMAPIGTAACTAPIEALAYPDIVKVVCDDRARALYFSRAPIPFLRETADAHLMHGRVRQHVGVYAYTRAALAQWVSLPPHPLEQIERLEQLRPLAAGLSIGVATATPSPIGGIDTPADLVRANAHWDAIHTVRSHA
jgi:3-deoxy-manno-octulosonate cytidylyltransferase (CMP-KDO synthetase)